LSAAIDALHATTVLPNEIWTQPAACEGKESKRTGRMLFFFRIS